MEDTLHIFYTRQDVRWQDYRWLALELDRIVQHNPDDMTRNISLRDLSELLQKLCLDDKIEDRLVFRVRAEQ